MPDAIPACCPAHAPAYPFARDRSHPLDPAGEFAIFRQERPVAQVTLWNGQPCWLVTRYADVQEALNDPTLSSVPANPGYPTLSETISASRKADPTFLRMDPPRHTEHRRMWSQYFTIKRIQAMKPGIRAIVERVTDRFVTLPQPADFVKDFALAIPSLVICQLLDVPDEAHDFFHRHSLTRTQLNGTPGEILAAMKALDDFWDAEIARREADPGEDIVSQLIVNEVRPGRLGREELRGMAQLMLLAGHETTANMIALTTLTLLRHPGQLARLRADRALVPAAVEEALRYLTVAQNGLGRTCIADTVIGGQRIRAGEGVLVVVASANRDASEFADPDRFDITREGTRRHMAFGGGIHQCLGHPLARAELQIVLDTLLDRLPNLGIAEAEDRIAYKYDSLFFGLYSLQVTW